MSMGLQFNYSSAFSVLVPQVGDPTFCGLEAVIYIYVLVDTSDPTEIYINPIARGSSGGPRGQTDWGVLGVRPI